MPRTLSTNAVTPALSGTLNINTQALPGSVAILVIVHAICLGGAFVFVFPLGIVILRWFASVRFHWMLQVFAVFASAIGLAVAIGFSVMDPEYNTLTEGHQIIGIVVVAALFLQAALGYVHHANYRKYERRTWASHAHLWTGRAVIIVGMLNTVLGFVLARNSLAAVAAGVLSILILVGSVVTTYFGSKRSHAKTGSEQQHFVHLPLSNYDPAHGSEDALVYGGQDIPAGARVQANVGGHDRSAIDFDAC